MKIVRIILILLIIFSAIFTYSNKYIVSDFPKITNTKNLIVFVDITEHTLEIIDEKNNEVLKKYVIASGKYSTPSPLGTFKVVSKGEWGEGFGTHWIGLNVPWGKYGLHGTDKPNSIGYASSHGCIRMRNKDIGEIYDYIGYGTKVTIWGGTFGPFGQGFRVIKPGHRGSDVYEVQKIMKEKGYYPMYVDGIYGEGMKKYVLKFKKDNNLAYNHYIDYEFYKALGIELFE